MKPMNRRQALGTSAAAFAALATGPAFAAKTKTYEHFAATPQDIFAATPYIFTVVTTDLDASIKFYSGVLNYSVIDKGKLGSSAPPLAGPAGRRYVLMRGLFEENVTERGVIRLLEAPAGTPPIRPPGSKNTDTGFVRFQARAIDADAAYRQVLALGIKPYVEPIFYSITGITPLEGQEVEHNHASRSFSIPGPAGERLNITTSLNRLTREMTGKLPHPGNIGIINAGVIYCLDRWPFLDFYDNALGIKMESDIILGSEPVNRLVGDPKGTQLFTGFMGGDFVEWKEDRQFRPPATPPYPQVLDKTGHAMTTALVDNLATVRAQCRQNGIPILGEGGLPSPEGKTRDAFYIRGAVGELYEVIGRS